MQSVAPVNCKTCWVRGCVQNVRADTLINAQAVRKVQVMGNVIVLDTRLCYVEGSFAYFTTQLLTEQFGDDWNDAPYEFNAGLPYEPLHDPLCSCSACKDDWNEDGTPKWEIVKVAFDGLFKQPCDLYRPYSVVDINQRGIPWLQNDEVKIYAGMSVWGFVYRIIKAGGEVYQRVNVV